MLAIAVTAVAFGSGCAITHYEPEPSVDQSTLARVDPTEVRIVPTNDKQAIKAYERVGEITLEVDDGDGVTDEALNDALQKEAAGRGCTAVQVLAENRSKGRGPWARFNNPNDLTGPPTARKVRAACLRDSGA